MKLFKNDFDKFYEELSTLNEDYSGITVDMSKLDPNNLSDKDWHDIKLAAQDACVNFRQPMYKWPLQFQLQYNAYKAEELAVDLLNNNADFREKVNDLLARNGDTRRLANHYKFNSQPWPHNILGAKAKSTANTEDRALSTTEDTVVDIISKEDIIKFSDFTTIDPNIYKTLSENKSELQYSLPNSSFDKVETSNSDNADKKMWVFETIKRIEVKCIGKADQKPKNFHTPQLVFVFNISEDSCTVYYWKNGKRELAEDKSYKVENIGIRQVCINVNPKEEGKVTCTTW